MKLNLKLFYIACLIVNFCSAYASNLENFLEESKESSQKVSFLENLPIEIKRQIVSLCDEPFLEEILVKLNKNFYNMIRGENPSLYIASKTILGTEFNFNDHSFYSKIKKVINPSIIDNSFDYLNKTNARSLKFTSDSYVDLNNYLNFSHEKLKDLSELTSLSIKFIYYPIPNFASINENKNRFYEINQRLALTIQNMPKLTKLSMTSYSLKNDKIFLKIIKNNRYLLSINLYSESSDRYHFLSQLFNILKENSTITHVTLKNIDFLIKPSSQETDYAQKIEASRSFQNFLKENKRVTHLKLDLPPPETGISEKENNYDIQWFKNGIEKNKTITHLYLKAFRAFKATQIFQALQKNKSIQHITSPMGIVNSTFVLKSTLNKTPNIKSLTLI